MLSSGNQKCVQFVHKKFTKIAPTVGPMSDARCPMAKKTVPIGHETVPMASGGRKI
jgi:hypothetical protein